MSFHPLYSSYYRPTALLNMCPNIAHNLQIILEHNICIFELLNFTRKIAFLRAAFFSSCGGLQPSAATVRPFRPKSGVLRAQPKNRMMNLFRFFFAEIHLTFFCDVNLKIEEISLERFEEICLKRFQKTDWKILRKSIWKSCGNQ